MRFTVLTLFPEVVTRYFTEGVVGRAVQKGLLGVEAVDIRDFTTDRHRSVDDVPSVSYTHPEPTQPLYQPYAVFCLKNKTLPQTQSANPLLSYRHLYAH